MSSFVSPITSLTKFSDDLFLPLLNEIQEVNKELEKLLDSKVSLVKEVGLKTFRSGGKRLRPALVIMSAKTCGNDYQQDRLIHLAACMELIHMATLIHDDVIDNASTRRGQPTAAILVGNTASVLTGDVIFAKVMLALTKDGDIELGRHVTSAVLSMAEGQILEVESRGRLDLSADKHLEILKMKTAALIECCCKIGAQISKANQQEIQQLACYGYHIGMAFQIIDDLLDFQGDQRITGKATATDFREGCATLPLIYLLEVLNDNEREFIKNHFGKNPSNKDINLIYTWMQERDICNKILKFAEDHIQKASYAIANIPDSNYKQMLIHTTDFVLNRKS